MIPVVDKVVSHFCSLVKHEQIKDIEGVLQEMDTDGDGALSMGEFASGLMSHQIFIDPHFLVEMFDAFDLGHNNSLDIDFFSETVNHQMASKDDLDIDSKDNGLNNKGIVLGTPSSFSSASLSQVSPAQVAKRSKAIQSPATEVYKISSQHSSKVPTTSPRKTASPMKLPTSTKKTRTSPFNTSASTDTPKKRRSFIPIPKSAPSKKFSVPTGIQDHASKIPTTPQPRLASRNHSSGSKSARKRIRMCVS